MAKELCGSCEARLATPVSFCPSCERPTRHATDAERVDWDLRQWRAHVDRSVAAGADPRGGALTAVAFEPAPHPVRAAVLEPAREPVRAEAAPEQTSWGRTGPALRVRMPRIHAPKLRRPRREPDLVIDLDRDHEFAYRACATCEDTDWVLRTTRNDDETWNYWCVRCSRSFKTEVKIRQAIKPFLSAGIVLGGITAASLLMLH